MGLYRDLNAKDELAMSRMIGGAKAIVELIDAKSIDAETAVSMLRDTLNELAETRAALKDGRCSRIVCCLHIRRKPS